MRNYDDMFEVRPSLIGTISTIGGTAIGAPIDTIGFADVLGVLTAGAMVGSAGANVTLSVKVQESAVPEGTGANWSDINNSTPNGTFAFSDLNFGVTNAGTYIPFQFDKQYALMKDANRKRYIRAHATLSGTVGHGPKFSATFLLGRPIDTLYKNDATTIGSGNVELTKLL
jgi:hypothetical protein